MKIISISRSIGLPALVFSFLCFALGCVAAPSDPAAPDEAASAAATGQISEDLTGSGCELDCTAGPSFSCTQPCSLANNTLTCPGPTTHTCPPCVPKHCSDTDATCGTVPDGCGGTLSCGTCPAGEQCVANSCEVVCPKGQTFCCGRCTAPQVCQKQGC